MEEIKDRDSKACHKCIQILVLTYTSNLTLLKLITFPKVCGGLKILISRSLFIFCWEKWQSSN